MIAYLDSSALVKRYLVERGSRVVYEWDAVSEEEASRSLRDEFFLKTRYASAGYPLVWEFRRMLLPPRSAFAVEFLSHKLLRWLAPVFLVLLLVSSLAAHSRLVNGFGALQLAFYAAAALGAAAHAAGLHVKVLYFPLYFCMGNGAALYGLLKLFRGGQSTLWRRAER